MYREGSQCAQGSFQRILVETEDMAMVAELSCREGSGQRCWRIMKGTQACSELFASHCERPDSCPMAIQDESRPLPPEEVWGVPPRD